MKTHVRAERMTHRPENHLMRHLRINGTGSDLMMVDGSVTPVYFQYIVPAGKRAIVERILVTALGPVIRPDTFVDIPAITNGLTIDILDADDNVLLDFLDGEPLRTNFHWAMLCGNDMPMLGVSGNALDMMPVRWTLGKSGWSTEMYAGEKFSVGIHDDLTTVNYFEMFIQGHVEDNE